MPDIAFIVAGLGLSLGVTSDFLFPVAVGVSAITTFTTPYLIKSSDKVYTLLEKFFRKNSFKVLKIIHLIHNIFKTKINGIKSSNKRFQQFSSME